MSFKPITVPANFMPANIVGIVAGNPFAIHTETGLLVLRVLDDATGLKRALQSRSLLVDWGSTGTPFYLYVAGQAFDDAYNLAVNQVGSPTPSLEAIAMAAGANSNSITFQPLCQNFDPGVVRHLSNFTAQRTPQTTFAFAVFNHGWLSGSGYTSRSDNPFIEESLYNGSTDFLGFEFNNLNFPWIGKATRLDTGSGQRHYPVANAISAVPTRYTGEEVLSICLAQVDSSIRDGVSERVRALLASENFDLTKLMYEPIRLSWRVTDQATLAINAALMDPICIAPRNGVNDVANWTGHAPIHGSRVTSDGDYYFNPPRFHWREEEDDHSPTVRSVFDNAIQPVNVISTLAGERVSESAACHALTGMIDGVSSAKVFGLQPFALFYGLDPVAPVYSARTLREFAGNHLVAGNLPARASFGLNPEGTAEAADSTAGAVAGAVMAKRQPGGTTRMSGTSTDDTYMMTCRTLMRLVFDPIYEDGLGISYDTNAANEILMKNAIGYVMPPVSTLY